LLKRYDTKSCWLASLIYRMEPKKNRKIRKTLKTKMQPKYLKIFIHSPQWNKEASTKHIQVHYIAKKAKMTPNYT